MESCTSSVPLDPTNDRSNAMDLRPNRQNLAAAITTPISRTQHFCRSGRQPHCGPPVLLPVRNAGGNVRDINGNYFNGGTNHFTTSSAADTTAPTSSSTPILLNVHERADRHLFGPDTVQVS